MLKWNPGWRLLPAIAVLFLAACAMRTPVESPGLDAVLQAGASARFQSEQATLYLDNDDAFAAKLALVEGAQERIDLAYFILADDYSSSRLGKALIDAARRGVQVRVLVDYHQAYGRLDWFDMLQAQGEGRLKVRFYSRPTRNIVMDAAYITLGCENAAAKSARCAPEKFAAIEQAFAAEDIDGREAGYLGISNLDVGGSGLFLSGLYGKSADLMALAVQQGQGIDVEALKASSGNADAGQAEQLKKLARIWFDARYRSGYEALKARFEGALARLLFAEQINPVYNSVNSYLPTERQDNSAARRDWDFFTEFLHHKILWVDGRRLIIGGRNVEDSYHLNPSPLSAKYVFSDSDIGMSPAKGDAISAAFTRLFEFRQMVASLEEVRQHAPNELLRNLDVHQAAIEACGGAQVVADCVAAHFARHHRARGPRLEAEHEALLAQVKRFERDYSPRAADAREPSLAVDPGARFSYLENLPMHDGRRGFGSADTAPAVSGKHIHAAWLSALGDTCMQASAEQPRAVVFYNAYFFLPANLLHALGQTQDGSWDCRHVEIRVITNSFATTDLNVVNIAAAWQMKAFMDFRDRHRDAERAAAFHYEELQQLSEGDKLSLHSKVMLFGDALFVGSANADVRSFMLDSNNGVLIEDAPQLVSQWQQWIQARRGQGLIRDALASLQIPVETLHEQSTLLLRSLLAKYDRKQRVDPQQQLELEARAGALMGEVYRLSAAVLAGDAEAREQFNALFKAI